MPWTKTNYPASMKNLSAGVRNKAIEIANAMLKQNKKMDEGILIATSIKNAKKSAIISEKKTAPAKKSKAVMAVKKSPVKKAKTIAAKKQSPLKKTKTVVAKKHSPVKKAKTVVAKKHSPLKKIKTVAVAKKHSPAKKLVKAVSVKKRITPAKKVVKIASIKKTQPIAKKTTKKVEPSKILSPLPSETKTNIIKENPVPPISIPETKTHGEDLHLIPGHEPIHPITTLEVHQNENIFHHREEVAFHQENQKVKAAMPSRKNKKITYRMKGRR